MAIIFLELHSMLVESSKQLWLAGFPGSGLHQVDSKS